MTENAATWIGNAFPDDVELSRLRALEGVWDENTCALLGRRVGVRRGWRCLELGAGAGSIARWLAEHVGPTGAVVAADVNCRFLTEMPDNVEVRALDASSADFGRDAFDLIHHRSVLSYVARREEVLARLARSLRPGGWLVSEEPDFHYRVVAADADEHLLARFFQALRRILEASGVDFMFAPRLVLSFQALGLTDIDHYARSHVAQGGSLISEVLWRAVEPLRAQLVDDAGFDDAEVERIADLLRGPRTLWIDPAIISVYGRRPG